MESKSNIIRLVKEYKCNPIIIQNNQGFFQIQLKYFK